MGVLSVLDERKEYLATWDLRMCAWITQLGFVELTQHLSNFQILYYKMNGDINILKLSFMYFLGM
jgi:hypothetical protein